MTWSIWRCLKGLIQLTEFGRRKPAWTDRILHLSADPTMVSQKSYQSCPVVTLSDHHPVSADFDICVRVPFICSNYFRFIDAQHRSANTTLINLTELYRRYSRNWVILRIRQQFLLSPFLMVQKSIWEKYRKPFICMCVTQCSKRRLQVHEAHLTIYTSAKWRKGLWFVVHIPSPRLNTSIYSFRVPFDLYLWN